MLLGGWRLKVVGERFGRFEVKGMRSFGLNEPPPDLPPLTSHL